MNMAIKKGLINHVKIRGENISVMIINKILSPTIILITCKWKSFGYKDHVYNENNATDANKVKYSRCTVSDQGIRGKR